MYCYWSVFDRCVRAAFAARIRLTIEGITTRPMLFADGRRFRQVKTALQIRAVIKRRVPCAGVCATAAEIIVDIELAFTFMATVH